MNEIVTFGHPALISKSADIEEIDDLHLYLNQQDNKFPPMALHDFYGEKIY